MTSTHNAITEPEVFVSLLRAIQACIPVLAQDADDMGFGQSYREHMDALNLCLMALDDHSALCRVTGVLSAGSSAYPFACELRKDWLPQ